MPTAAFSTDAARRAVGDVGSLLAFRRATARHPRRGRLVPAGFTLITAVAALGPAWVSGAGSSAGHALDALLLLPSALAGFVALAVLSAAASGGGRELLARDPASVHPISPTTDHLGALLLAPLNVAWLLQFWALLGLTAYAVGPARVAGAQVVVLLWVAAATSFGQATAWSVECLRRTRHGVLAVRVLTLVVVGGILGLQLVGRLVPALDRLPTRQLVRGAEEAPGVRWALTVLGLLLAVLAVGALGAVPAHLAARRLPRDELDAESGHHPPRRRSASLVGALVRLDRASVWRAVPMRRGMAVLALGPGVVAVLGDLDWPAMTILPGLVASGGALLYGVNAWCLDGRGALWRESLPVGPGTVFDARAYVLAEFLLAASVLTVLVAGLRAGFPDPAELAALLATVVVVTVQVVGGAMRWSARRPFAVDLRSARATPAPPATMVAYSTRLALSTTVTGLVFSSLARLPDWSLPLLVAVPMLLWSGARLARTRAAWLDPVARAGVVTTVAVG